jgi:hypothetical protein
LAPWVRWPPWARQGEEHRGVSLAAGVRLDVGVVGTEQLLGAFDGQGLDLVHVFAATVVALARVAFGVFVGQAAALGLHDALAGVVFRRDQFDMVFLTLLFGIHRRQQRIVITLDLVLLAEHRVSPSGGGAPFVSVRPASRQCPLDAMVGPALPSQMPMDATQRCVYDMGPPIPVAAAARLGPRSDAGQD